MKKVVKAILCVILAGARVGAAAKMPRGFFIPWKMRAREALSWLNYLLRKAL